MYALRVIVALVARDRKAESTSLHTVTYDVPHRFDFGVGSCALLAFIAHHVEADRGMADEIAGIDPEPPVCRKSLTLRPRTVSREPPGSLCPLVGWGAVRANDRQPEQLTGDAHAYPA